MSSKRYGGKAFVIVLAKLIDQAAQHTNADVIGRALDVTAPAIANVKGGSNAISLAKFADMMKVLGVKQECWGRMMVMATFAYETNSNWKAFQIPVQELSVTAFPAWNRDRKELPAVIERIERGDRAMLDHFINQVTVGT